MNEYEKAYTEFERMFLLPRNDWDKESKSYSSFNGVIKTLNEIKEDGPP